MSGSNNSVPCDNCDKMCAEHGKNDLLINQYGIRISDVETNVDLINADISNTEGRLTMFTWGVGLVFMLIVSVAFYGVLQLDEFKKIYVEDNRSSGISILKLSADVEVINNDISYIKDDINELKTIQRNILYHKNGGANNEVNNSYKRK